MKLIIINGPCGVGKTTLSERLVQDYTLMVHVDIDRVRKQITHFRENRAQSSELAFEVAFGMVERALGHGVDVLVDKIFFNSHDAPRQYLEDLVEIGERYDATIHEFILNADKATILQRATDRGFGTGGILTPEKVDTFYDAIQLYMTRRPHAMIVDTTTLLPEDVYKYVKKNIDGK